MRFLRVAALAACALSFALPASAQVIGSGHVMGTGTSAARTPTDTPLNNILQQSGSGVTLSGNTSTLATVSGTVANGHCRSTDSNGNEVDAGGPCMTGGSGGTVNSGTAGQLSYYGSTGSAVSGLGSISTGISPQITLGSDIVIGGSVVWDTASVRAGGTLSLNTSAGGGPSSDEFLTTFQSTQAATSYYTGTTNAGTATSSNVLHFASVPVGIANGMGISDTTHSTAIAATQTISSFTGTTVTMSSNANGSGVQSGDSISFGFNNFKGPIFLGTLCNDTSTYDITRSCNGITAYSEIGTGVTNGYSEGIVTMSQQNGTGTGILIGGEFDVAPLDAATNVNCDISGASDCHTNIWVANIGTVAASWMFDSGVGGPGWINGIDIRNVSGVALNIPNSKPITSNNAAETGYIDLIYDDGSDNVVVGFGASATLTYNHLASGGSPPAVTSCGSGPSISGTDTKGKIQIGSGTVTGCTITWASTYAAAPTCIVTAGGNYTIWIAFGQPTTTGLSLNSSANMAGTQVSYMCIQ